MKNYRELFLKYLQNDLKGDELKSILQWLNNPANIHEFESMMDADWSTFNSKNNNYTGINESFEALKDKITSNRNTRLTISEKRRILRNQNRINPKIRNLILRIAAGILILLTVGIVAYQAGKNSQPESKVVFNEIAVPMGSKTQIELSDGTKIWLNSGSRLKYPQKFTGKSREVELEGEGYFDVVKNPKTPFIVKASDLNIKVLGTTFNVKAYPEEGSIETTLVKGTIQISKISKSGETENTISLKPKERATYIKEKGKLILSEVEKKVETAPIQVEEEAPKRKEHILFMKDVDTEQFTAWKDNKLVFKNEDLESLCIKLERWYNVKINLKSKDLKKFHYTGTIENETINDVIKIIQLTMPIDYDIDHSTIDIWSKQQCN